MVLGKLWVWKKLSRIWSKSSLKEKVQLQKLWLTSLRDRKLKKKKVKLEG